MAVDWDKVDEVTMALLSLTSFTEHGFTAAWKTHSWDVTDRLHQKGWLNNPVGKAKSVVLTEEGVRQAEALLRKALRHTGRDEVDASWSLPPDRSGLEHAC